MEKKAVRTIINDDPVCSVPIRDFQVARSGSPSRDLDLVLCTKRRTGTGASRGLQFTSQPVSDTQRKRPKLGRSLWFSRCCTSTHRPVY
ncbi:hypothetical protein RRG08_031044 [Elysia crispata]|uniref:Uncharacterized protein n=1 Tax=Elysia crispata TaxID=231223 RepID=A0AAE0ZFI6_9GAST|nr:hypothetical protein RRG08_031044 [Elysia crispata]